MSTSTTTSSGNISQLEARKRLIDLKEKSVNFKQNTDEQIAAYLTPIIEYLTDHHKQDDLTVKKDDESDDAAKTLAEACRQAWLKPGESQRLTAAAFRSFRDWKKQEVPPEREIKPKFATEDTPFQVADYCEDINDFVTAHPPDTLSTYLSTLNAVIDWGKRHSEFIDNQIKELKINLENETKEIQEQLNQAQQALQAKDEAQSKLQDQHVQNIAALEKQIQELSAPRSLPSTPRSKPETPGKINLNPFKRGTPVTPKKPLQRSAASENIVPRPRSEIPGPSATLEKPFVTPELPPTVVLTKALQTVPGGFQLSPVEKPQLPTPKRSLSPSREIEEVQPSPRFLARLQLEEDARNTKSERTQARQAFGAEAFDLRDEDDQEQIVRDFVLDQE